jgi:hypothetical protein
MGGTITFRGLPDMVLESGAVVCAKIQSPLSLFEVLVGKAGVIVWIPWLSFGRRTIGYPRFSGKVFC